MQKGLTMKTLLLGAIIICFFAGLHSMPTHSTTKDDNNWWNTPYPSQFDSAQLRKQLDFISVKGNQLVDESGKPFIFRGVSVADPDKLLREGQWSEAMFKEIKAWGANIVRLPIHPVSWQGHGKDAYFALIDQAIIWANAHDMYIIIDWHSIGNLPVELFQHSMYDTTVKETRTFWKDVAFRYAGVSTVAVYELFNEPTDQGGRAGQANWAEWKALNEDLIDIVYAHDKKVIPLVAGYNWAYDLRPIKAKPIAREGIAYTAHPYPQKAKPQIATKENFFSMWDEVWGFAAKDYPIIATELGWVNANGKGAHIPVINDGSYGPQIIEFMHDRNISWVAWVFDPDWSPTMISDWDYTPTQQGAFFKEEMQKHQ